MNKTLIIIGAVAAGYLLATTLAQYPVFSNAYMIGAQAGSK